MLKLNKEEKYCLQIPQSKEFTFLVLNMTKTVSLEE